MKTLEQTAYTMAPNLGQEEKNLHFLNSAIETHIVGKNDIFYTKGRNLAKKAYKQVWNTERLIDGNHYGIVVCKQGVAIGNINLQLRSEDGILKSEKFFGKEHWKSHFETPSNAIAELSGLAISEDLPQELRRPVMMMLIAGISSLCCIEGIKYLVTVQHEFLIRILTKSLHLPFFRNELIEKPVGELPNDDYWKREKAPNLYYLDILNPDTHFTCASFIFYLNSIGLSTSFIPRVNTADYSYTSFRKNLKLA